MIAQENYNSHREESENSKWGPKENRDERRIVLSLRYERRGLYIKYHAWVPLTILKTVFYSSRPSTLWIEPTSKWTDSMREQLEETRLQ